MKTPPVLYAKSGDLQIAYTVAGNGPVDLVWCPGFVSHLQLQWDSPHWGVTMRKLASFTRLINFDKRGTGMSDRPSGIPTLEERIDDIRAVMDAAQSERAHILGVSEGGTMACLFAATYPDRTRSLPSMGCGRAGRARRTTRGARPRKRASGTRWSGSRTAGGTISRPSTTSIGWGLGYAMTLSSWTGSRDSSNRPRVPGPEPRSTG